MKIVHEIKNEETKLPLLRININSVVCAACRIFLKSKKMKNQVKLINETLTGRISQLSCVLAEKALIDEYTLLPEDLVDNEGNYLPKYQDEFNNYYDCYYNELSSYIINFKN